MKSANVLISYLDCENTKKEERDILICLSYHRSECLRFFTADLSNVSYHHDCNRDAIANSHVDRGRNSGPKVRMAQRIIAAKKSPNGRLCQVFEQKDWNAHSS